ncbi:MAG: hypothetical protein CMF62_01345 [Magnetococcales bacterium]|nr:hypothetical protein [Magnetococcales bacterium]MBA42639.1 hypothetical protein [Magnetococcales bacterium]
MNFILHNMALNYICESMKTYNSWFFEYYECPNELTQIIDKILVSNPQAEVTNKIIKGIGSYIPGIGTHYFYLYENFKKQSAFYVYFEKYKTDTTKYKLSVFKTKKDKKALEQALTAIFKSSDDTINIINTCTSMGRPFNYVLNVKYNKPYPNQQIVVDHIINQYEKDKNSVIMLSGEPGCGKSSTAYVLKKEMEKRITKGVIPRLFSNIDLATPNLDIGPSVLQTANPHTPVILVLNEFDIVMAIATMKNSNRFENCVHIKNKTSLNNTLDLLNIAGNFICIITTNKSISELKSNPNYETFLRKNRIDTFFEVNKETAITKTHDDY